jgi:hypothetical protein
MVKEYLAVALESDTGCSSRVLDLVLDNFLMVAPFFIYCNNYGEDQVACILHVIK